MSGRRGVVRRRPGLRAVAVLALALTAASACSSGSTAGATATTARTTESTATASTQAATPSATLASGPCPGTDLVATSTTISDSAGRHLVAAVAGSGSTTVLFVHESGSQGMCGFADFAQWLARSRHVRAILFEQCGYGASRCPDMSEAGSTWVGTTRSVVTWARQHGARRVVLVGASFGGTVALAVAGGTAAGVSAVADLSGERSINGLDAVRLAPRVRTPLVLAVAPGDSYVSVADMRAVASAATGTHPAVVVSTLTGAHGWELLQDSPTEWSPAARAVAALT